MKALGIVNVVEIQQYVLTTWTGMSLSLMHWIGLPTYYLKKNLVSNPHNSKKYFTCVAVTSRENAMSITVVKM